MGRNSKTKMSGLITSFDVDFADCDCEGTKAYHGYIVLKVKWHRLDTERGGAILFTCTHCETSWKRNHVWALGSGIFYDASHPEEIERRRNIPNFKETCVNLYNGARDLNRWDTLRI